MNAHRAAVPAGPAPSSPASRARDAAYLVASQVVVSVCVFATGIVLARTVGAAGKGYYDVAAASATLLATLLGLSLGSGIFFHAARGAVDGPRLTGWALSFAALQAIVAGSVLNSARESPIALWLMPQPSDRSVVLLIALLLAAIQGQMLLRGLAMGAGRFAAFAASDVLSRSATLVAVVALATAGVTSPAVFVGAFACSMAAGTALLAREGARLDRKEGRLPLREIAWYSLPLYAGNLVQFLNYRLDVFFLNRLLDVASVGVYTVAAAIAQLLWLVPNALANVVLRDVAERGECSESMARTAAVNRFCLWSAASMAVVLFAVSAATVSVVFGSAFGRSLPALAALLPGVVLFCPTIILSAYLNGIRRQIYTTWIACGSLVLTILFNAWLIPTIGILGAALASTASYGFSSAVTILVVRRRHPDLPWRDLVGLRRADIDRGLSILRSFARYPHRAG